MPKKELKREKDGKKGRSRDKIKLLNVEYARKLSEALRENIVIGLLVLMKLKGVPIIAVKLLAFDLNQKRLR